MARLPHHSHGISATLAVCFVNGLAKCYREPLLGLAEVSQQWKEMWIFVCNAERQKTADVHRARQQVYRCIFVDANLHWHRTFVGGGVIVGTNYDC